MNKVYKGYELIKEIAEGNIKERNKDRDNRQIYGRFSRKLFCL